jgi:recombination protein RecR
MASGEPSGALSRLIQVMGRLPGLGPRSARRLVLHLLKRRESAFTPLLAALTAVAETVETCAVCGNLDTQNPCAICRDDTRNPALLCVVEDVDDLWAMERTNAFNGTYHVLGGLLSALDGMGPEELGLGRLRTRVQSGAVQEVILALSATVDGQTTAHTIVDTLHDCDISLSRLAHGVPMGGELEYLDDGTLAQAFRARCPL